MELEELDENRKKELEEKLTQILWNIRKAASDILRFIEAYKIKGGRFEIFLLECIYEMTMALFETIQTIKKKLTQVKI
jgi:hypothetical protein